MKELIKIGTTRIGDNSVMTVSAREIAEFLGLGKDFTNWIKVQIKRAKLVQGVDYIVVKIYPQEGEKIKRGRPPEDYYRTIEAGKHICMLSQVIRVLALVMRLKIFSDRNSYYSLGCPLKIERITNLRTIHQA